MDEEQVEFRTGRDSYGLTQWVPALVLGREQRTEGEWLRVLPKYSTSDEDAQWVRNDDARPLRR